ncbi:Tyrocidine synthase 3 [Kordia antarctica]|uniref:Tyrocidine synthase 3 n=1 Tax=Kordia antarctica TaxID=1218801 RepID=A0A7L4ZG87_9FLAO|nr:non-ribosomal peptide synthetase [Kordia antarctica]QHI35457.1 Tyrocidine synthase 3 [Kordia antarctica]
MDTIKQQIASNYWLQKISSSITEDSSSASNKKEVVKEVIVKEHLAYFSKLTNASPMAQYTVLLSVFNALLRRYFNTENDIFSSKVGAEDIQLLFKSGSIKNATLKTYLQETKKEVQEVYKHTNYDENKLHEKYPFAKYATYSFLYNSKPSESASMIPFTLSVHTSSANLALEIVYDASFVTKAIASHFLTNFKNWILELEQYINVAIEKITIVTTKEQEQLLTAYNAATESYPEHKTLVDLFEEQVIKTPHAIALIIHNNTLSYAELNERANQLAYYIQETYKTLANDLIAIKLERDENLLITILAVLKTGAAYVPVDVKYPKQRIAYIEKDSKSKVIIDAEFIKNFYQVENNYSKENLSITRDDESLAYVIYTSGTTGNPKGVMISHKNAVAFIHWAQKEFDADKIDIVYAATSHCFDLSIYEMFFSLSIGKKIRILKDILEATEALKKDTKILINTVPSAMRNIIEHGCSLDNVSIINLAGEPFPVDIGNKLLKTKAEIRNLYGPSEDTTYSTFYQLDPEKEYIKSIPIGVPISNTRAYILDDNLELLPLGVPGRLYLSGNGLAKGYLNRQELTNEKFVNNPFEEGKRMYDTGDIAKWSTNKNIEYLGRKDHQVKLRGYRIELGEIENAVTSYSDAIGQAVIIVSNQVLLGYYTANETIHLDALKLYLQEQLPSYMIPSRFIQLDAIPLTPNGKIDKKALEDLKSDCQFNDNYIAPRNEKEQRLAKIWSEVLGVEKIGIRDNFFELGGHSLMIGKIINKIYKELDGSINYKEFFQYPIIEEMCKYLKDDNYAPISKIEKKEYYPLTPSQNRFWIMSHLSDAKEAYVISGAVKVIGAIDEKLFVKAFEHIVVQHESLRTVFKKNEHGEISQYILEESEVSQCVDVVDISAEEISEAKLTDYVNTLQAHDFTLSEAPLCKAILIKTSNNEAIFHIRLHHIIADGYSMEVLTKSVLHHYDTLLSGEVKLEVNTDAIQYKDYTIWLEAQNKTEAFEESKNYWLDEFAERVTTLSIPGYQKRPVIKSYSGNSIWYEYSSESFKKLDDFSKSHKVTLYTVLSSAVNVLLSRYSSQEEIITGIPVAGREHPDLEEQIGLYINTVALKSIVKPKDSFATIVQKTGSKINTVLAHQSYPFNQLIEELSLQRDLSRSPLFDVMVVLQNQSQSSDLEKQGNITFEPYELTRNSCQYDLVFNFIKTTETSLTLELQYNTDIYTEEFVARMIGHLEIAVNALLTTPEKDIQNINFISDQEKERIVNEFNNTKIDIDRSLTVIDAYKTQVKKHPNYIAVQSEQSSFTYKELHEKSNAFGHYLQKEFGIKEGDLVVVKLDRNEHLITTLLGILKIGAAYVPVDTQYPKKRIQYIIEDTSAVLIVNAQTIKNFQSYSNWNISEHSTKLQNNTLAYIIYTSGSTGKPKGVMITHGNLMNLCQWHVRYYMVTKGSRGTLFSSIGFDASVWEIYPYLISGATLYPIEDNEIRLHIPSLISFLNTNQITHSYLPSKVCQEVLAQNTDEVRTKLLTGGEAFTYNSSTTIDVYNNYGPTENTVVTTVFKCNQTLAPNVPIGKPIDNTQVYILSKGLQIQPINVVGELYISGLGVSKGYWNRQEITAKNFIDHPFKEGEKLYKTGDRACWLPDGNIAFHGRIDHQIKIRGYRIELEEIIHCVNSYPNGISQSIVVLNSKNNIDSLVAYYVATSEIDKNDLSEYLQTQLPDYMIPKSYVQVEAIPLTANGKVNYDRLPEISIKDVTTKVYKKPTSDTEIAISKIWEQLLHTEKISVADDFFELGGHSLLITKLLSAYQKTFGKSIALKDLFSQTTIKNHAQLIESSTTYGGEIIKVSIQEHYAISPSQMRYWLIDKLQGGSKEFNIYSAFDLPKDTNVEVFKESFQDLVIRHEALRTVFVEDAGMPRQSIFEIQEIEIPLFSNVEEAKTFVFEHIFDLNSFPLFKVALVVNTNGTLLFFNLHHSIGDGWTMHILQRDLLKLYEARLKNAVPDLPELPIQYKDYCGWQNEQIALEEYTELKEYWKQQFSGSLTYLDLPSDFPIIKEKEKTAASYSIFISEKVKIKIETLAQSSATSVFGVLLSSLKMILSRLTSEKDIIIGIPVANRNHYQLKNVAGCFINTLMIRNEFDENISAKQWIKNVGNTLKNALKNQNYPFEKLLENLNVAITENRFPMSPVFFNMVDFDEEHTTIITNFEAKHEATDAVPKFDLEYYGKTYANGIELNCVYNNKVFTQKTIALWTNEILALIEQIVEEDTKPLKKYTLFDYETVHEEEARPTNAFTLFENEEIEQTISSRFEKQVRKTPNAIAVNTVTYNQLNVLANYVAAEVSKNRTSVLTERIALLLPHNEFAVIGMLATLKSGCSYVPIDNDAPLDRILYILKDANCKQLLYAKETKLVVNQVVERDESLIIHEISLQNQQEENIKTTSNCTPNSEAYVLYTSGSTGVPKGVIQNQRNVLHYIKTYTNNIHITTEDNLSVFSSYTFDASVKDIYGAILNGASVSFYNLLKDDIHNLSIWISHYQISIIHMVPTLYRAFLNIVDEKQKLSSVRIVDLGGESCHKLDFELFTNHFSKEAFLINDYGPTEATIVSQKFFNHNSVVIGNNLSIGKSVTNTDVFIQNSSGEVAKIYEEGEIVFKSAFLSLGYLNKKEQTKKVFTKDSNSPNKRYYKSGDIGKKLPNGEIIFLRRKDQQTKINGFRIELAEIEYQLLQIEGIEKAVVLVKEVLERKVLTAYLQKNKEEEDADVKEKLAKILPKYMIPQRFITMDTFPLTRTGKIDRKKLPEPEANNLNTVVYKAPTSEVEKSISELLAAVLNIEVKTIGIDHNFFELGGNSLQGVLLINKINKKYETNFSISNLYEALTVKDLAMLVEFYLSQKQYTTQDQIEEDEVII